MSFFNLINQYNKSNSGGFFDDETEGDISPQMAMMLYQQMQNQGTPTKLDPAERIGAQTGGLFQRGFQKLAGNYQTPEQGGAPMDPQTGKPNYYRLLQLRMAEYVGEGYGASDALYMAGQDMIEMSAEVPELGDIGMRALEGYSKIKRSDEIITLAGPDGQVISARESDPMLGQLLRAGYVKDTSQTGQWVQHGPTSEKYVTRSPSGQFVDATDRQGRLLLRSTVSKTQDLTPARKDGQQGAAIDTMMGRVRNTIKASERIDNIIGFVADNPAAIGIPGRVTSLFSEVRAAAVGIGQQIANTDFSNEGGTNDKGFTIEQLRDTATYTDVLKKYNTGIFAGQSSALMKSMFVDLAFMLAIAEQGGRNISDKDIAYQFERIAAGSSSPESTSAVLRNVQDQLISDIYLDIDTDPTIANAPEMSGAVKLLNARYPRRQRGKRGAAPAAGAEPAPISPEDQKKLNTYRVGG